MGSARNSILFSYVQFYKERFHCQASARRLHPCPRLPQFVQRFSKEWYSMASRSYWRDEFFIISQRIPPLLYPSSPSTPAQPLKDGNDPAGVAEKKNAVRWIYRWMEKCMYMAGWVMQTASQAIRRVNRIPGDLIITLFALLIFSLGFRLAVRALV